MLTLLSKKVKEMAKEEAKKLLEKLGVHVVEVTDEIVAKVEAYKAELDTETRRKTRLFWAVVAAVCPAVSFGIGYML